MKTHIPHPVTTSDGASVRYLVDDVAASVDFYQRHLGFVLRTDAGPAFAELVRGSLRLLLSGPASTAGRPTPDGRTPEPGGWNRIHLVVDALDVEARRLSAAGVAFRHDIVGGPGGRRILIEDPSGNPVELFEPASPPPGDATREPQSSTLRSTVLLRGEDTGGHVALVENTVPAGSAGPPLHRHDFDEAFYVLQGELVFRIGDALMTRTAGQVVFAPRGMPHALANPGQTPARYVLVCTPAGFERHFARLDAQAADTEPPPWSLGPVPEVVTLGPPLGHPSPLSG